MPAQDLVPMVGEALVGAGICKVADGAFVSGATALLQGSLELVVDIVPLARETLDFQVNCPRILSFEQYLEKRAASSLRFTRPKLPIPEELPARVAFFSRISSRRVRR